MGDPVPTLEADLVDEVKGVHHETVIATFNDSRLLGEEEQDLRTIIGNSESISRSLYPLKLGTKQCRR